VHPLKRPLKETSVTLYDMLLEIMVYWLPDDFDSEKEEIIGRKPKMKPDIMVVNTDHICAFHPHDSGGTMLRLSNGDVFQSTYKFESFREVMEELQISKDLLVSGDN
jgi:hypothetical protein